MCKSTKCHGLQDITGYELTRAYRAFSSFPDTSLFAEGSIMFSFKIRHIPPEPSTLRLPEPPSPMPNQVDKMEQAMEMSSIEPTRSSSSSSSYPQGGSDDNPAPNAGRQEKTGTKAEEYRKWNERGREWVYGYVWFEQRKDVGIARGYMQVSRSVSSRTGLLLISRCRNHSSFLRIYPFHHSLQVYYRQSLRSSLSTAIRHSKPHATRLLPGKLAHLD